MIIKGEVLNLVVSGDGGGGGGVCLLVCLFVCVSVCLFVMRGEIGCNE